MNIKALSDFMSQLTPSESPEVLVILELSIRPGKIMAQVIEIRGYRW